MITIDLLACEPHRAGHALIVVSGMRRRPVSTRFSIQAQMGGHGRYLGPRGWEDKFTECRELQAGWDADKRVLWILLGPDVTRLLGQTPFTFALLQSGEHVTELMLPAALLSSGGEALAPFVESEAKGVAELLPLPGVLPVPVERVVVPAPVAVAVEPGSRHGDAPPVPLVVMVIGVAFAAIVGGAILLASHGS